MKKIVSLLLIVTTLFSLCLVSCEEEKPAAPIFTAETLADNFAAIEEAGKIADVLPIATMTEVITSENSEFIVTLTADDFTANVSEAQVSMAMMSAQAHLVAFFKVKEGVTAESLAKLVSEKFDTRRWVCVDPEKCATIYAGDYVLLVASHAAVTDAYIAGFKSVAGEAASSENVFFTGAVAE